LCNHAIRAAYDYLKESQKVDPATIVLLGRSLGTGPTVDLASQVPDIAGTILQSPLESGIRCVLGTCGSAALYPLDIFRSYAKVEQIVGPVFILHGQADRIVPCRNGMALAALLEQRPNHAQVAYEPVWIPSRGHNDMPAEYCMMLFQRFLFFLPSYQSSLREKQETIAAQERQRAPSPDQSEGNATTQSEEERKALAEEQERQRQLELVRQQREQMVLKPPTRKKRSTPLGMVTAKEAVRMEDANLSKIEPLLPQPPMTITHNENNPLTGNRITCLV